MALKKDYITDFDSGSSMIFALGHHLRGKGFKGCGIAPALPEFVGSLLNAIPLLKRREIYRWSGWVGAVPEKKVAEVDEEDIAEWIIRQYPKRSYPGAMIGSSNGAAMHLCAALGIPYVPQTVLLSIRRNLHPDEIKPDTVFGRRIAGTIRARNPGLQIHQMHDPLQDRLMVSKMAYFRIKRKRLGRRLEDYLARQISPGGVIFIFDCRFRWPQYRIGPDHYFQIGGLGGLQPEEYLNGSPEIDRFLRAYHSEAHRWRLDGETSSEPEAEWGYLEDLTKEVKSLARRQGFRVCQIRVPHPQGLSDFVADLYRWWYRRRGLETNQLLAESFALFEPHWTIKTGTVPYWMAFNDVHSCAGLERYLDRSEAFDFIYLMLMSNGIPNAIGLTPIERWEKILARAQRHGDFIGVDKKRYPVDFGTFIRYANDLKKKIKELPPPRVPPLTLAELEEFARGRLPDGRIEWIG